MKLAFSRPTEDDAEQRLLFSSFRSAGFEGLQLKASQYQRYLSDPERFRENWGDDIGAASALITGGTLDDAGLTRLRRVIAFARSVGSERVVFCHGLPRAGLTHADIAGFARIMSEVGTEARDTGVRLSLHHHHDQPVMYREDFETFFSAVGEGAIGLTIDTAHLVKSGITNVGAMIREFSAVVDNVHLKDYADGDFRVLGRGQIDFGPVFEALREVGYDGWLCADEESGSDIPAGLAASREFIRAQLGREAPGGA